jgi:hypothetical protein
VGYLGRPRRVGARRPGRLGTLGVRAQVRSAVDLPMELAAAAHEGVGHGTALGNAISLSRMVCSRAILRIDFAPRNSAKSEDVTTQSPAVGDAIAASMVPLMAHVTRHHALPVVVLGAARAAHHPLLHAALEPPVRLKLRTRARQHHLRRETLGSRRMKSTSHGTIRVCVG